MTQPSGGDVRIIGTFWSLSLDEAGRTIVPRIPATFSAAGPEVAGEIARAMGQGDPAPVLQRFVARRRCYVARVEGQIVSYGWVTFDRENIGEIGLSFRLPTASAYIWDCATLPAYRGQRLYPALLAYMLDELRLMGLRRAWIGADADNLPSQTGFSSVGFSPIMDIVQTPTGLQMRARAGAPAQLVDEVCAGLEPTEVL